MVTYLIVPPRWPPKDYVFIPVLEQISSVLRLTFLRFSGSGWAILIVTSPCPPNRLPADQRRGYKNVFNALIRIAREEGVPTLWRVSEGA